MVHVPAEPGVATVASAVQCCVRCSVGTRLMSSAVNRCQHADTMPTTLRKVINSLTNNSCIKFCNANPFCARSSAACPCDRLGPESLLQKWDVEPCGQEEAGEGPQEIGSQS